MSKLRFHCSEARKWWHGFSVAEDGEGEARGQRHAETDFVESL